MVSSSESPVHVVLVKRDSKVLIDLSEPTRCLSIPSVARDNVSCHDHKVRLLSLKHSSHDVHVPSVKFVLLSKVNISELNELELSICVCLKLIVIISS